MQPIINRSNIPVFFMVLVFWGAGIANALPSHGLLELMSAMAIADVSATTVGSNLEVSENKHFLVNKETGRPWFFLGDTAWELLYKLNREETIQYLDERQGKKFSVIQTTLIGIFNGTNRYGDSPFNGNTPNVTDGNDPENGGEYDFWDHVEFVIDECGKRDMYLSASCAWSNSGGGVSKPTPYEYGKFLGDRFKEKPNVIWICIGDASADGGLNGAYDELAKGLAEGTSGTEDYDNVLISYHPIGASTTMVLKDEPWMDFNLCQTGGSGTNINDWLNFIPSLYNATPTKPCEDYEPVYENIFGRQTALTKDVRRAAWWSVLEGAFGHTYGEPALFQMYRGDGDHAWDGADRPWSEALKKPGSGQMTYLRTLIESRPMLSRVPDQTLVTNDYGTSWDHVVACRGEGYAFLYCATGKPISVSMGKISGDEIKAWWYNPKTGEATEIGTFPNSGTKEFTPSSSGDDNDWTLVLDDVSKGFSTPGTEVFDVPAVATPVIEPAGGTFTDSTLVTITTKTSGAMIYYTTDESDPTEESTEYTTAVVLKESATVKAIAVKDGMKNSEIEEQAYMKKPVDPVNIVRGLRASINSKAVRRRKATSFTPSGKMINSDGRQQVSGVRFVKYPGIKMVKKAFIR